MPITAPDANLTFWPNALTAKESHSLFSTLYDQIPWRQDNISLFGKTMKIPRLQAWYGDQGLTYRYSGILMKPEPWIPLLNTLKNDIEVLCGHEFNSVLLNLYRHGQDSNGWHSDDEAELGQDPVIASLSLGETRRFRLRHKQGKVRNIDPLSFDLPSGSLLLMAGSTQACWQHCLPKTSKRVEPRINLTFRKIIHGTS